MNTIETLENKVNALIELVKGLKKENIALLQENKRLVEQVKKLEDVSEKQRTNVTDLHQEKELTKKNVNELIRIIDSFIETGKPA